MKRKVINKLLAICLSVAMITGSMMPVTAAASQLPSEKTTEASTKVGVTLYKVKVVLPNTTSATKVTSLSVKQNGKDYTYSSAGLTTDSKGGLSLNLPANAAGQSTSVTVNNVTFTGTVKAGADNTLATTVKQSETQKTTGNTTGTGSSTGTTSKTTETSKTSEVGKTETGKNETGKTEAGKTDTPETKATESKVPETKVPETEKADSKTDDIKTNGTEKSTDGKDASETVDETKGINKASPALEAIGIDYIAEKFTNTKATMEYSVDGGTNWIDCTEGTTTVNPVADQVVTVIIRDKVNPNDKVERSVNARLKAPVVTVKNVSAEGASDGSLTVTNAGNDGYEYQAPGTTAWLPMTKGEKTGLGAGDFKVRKTATTTDFSSFEVTKTIFAAPKASNITIGDLSKNVVYGEGSALGISLTNTGGVSATVKVELTGENKDKFKIVNTDGNSTVDSNKTINNFQIEPNSKLSVGKYVGTVSVSYGSSAPVTTGFTYTVGQKELIVTNLNANNRAYNGTKSVDINVEYQGTVPGDKIDLKATGELDSPNSGSRKVTNITFYLDKASAVNYKINSSNTTLPEVTITKVDVKADIKSVKNKTYDGTKRATGTYQLLPAGKDKIVESDKAILELDGDIFFTDADAGRNKKVTAPKIELNGDKNSNYNLTNPSIKSVTTKATIEKAKNENTPSSKPTIKKYTYNTIEISVVSTQDYRLGDDGKWMTVGKEFNGTFNNLKPETTYTIYTRYSEDKNHLAGEGTTVIQQQTRRQPTITNPENNRIDGMSSSYAKGSRVSFTAVGTGMDNTSPSVGDTRYVPKSYYYKSTSSTSTSSTSLTQAPYTGSFTISTPNSYTLTVTYQKQVYDYPKNQVGGVPGWGDETNVTDTKSKSFTISNSTTSPTNSPSTTKPGVKTGDVSPIIPLAVLLVVSGGLIIVLTFSKKRRRSRQ